jgi:hypothetical protein
MLYWLIENDERVGDATELPEVLPSGWKVIEVSPDQAANPTAFYIKEGTVLEKPHQPSEAHFWDFSAKEWILPPPPPEPLPQPDYLGFRVGMLRDAGYDRVTLASNVLRVTRMETAVSQNPPELPIVAAMWGVLIDELSDKPTAAEIKSWNAIASSTNVPLTFGKNGKMNLA